MKLFYIICVLIIGTTSVSEVDEIYKLLTYEEGQRYFITTDLDDNFILVDTFATEVMGKKFLPEFDVYFQLYTRKNPMLPQLVRDKSSLESSNFDIEKPVKIIIHGWMNDGTSLINKLIKERFLKALDVNVICVDWSEGSEILYTTAVENVPLVGKFIGRWIDWLIGVGVDIDNFHIIGHSLGGHIAGITGRSVKSGKIPYITALDPALPLWDNFSPRVIKSDAKYLEVIHTDSGNFGIEEPIGHNDFYPNGGKIMPGCEIFNVGCAHRKSYEYFAYSLDNKYFMGYQCKDMNEIKKNRCSKISKLHMGGASPKPERGIFIVKTRPEPPYYMK